MEDHVVEPQHARAGSSGLGGSGAAQDPGMVCAQIGSALPSRSTVRVDRRLRALMVLNPPGSVAPGSYHRRSPTAKWLHHK